jgi:hypothetical protein
LSNQLVSRDDTEEDSQRVEASTDKVEDIKGNFPAAAEVAEDESKDERQRFQGESEDNH